MHERTTTEMKKYCMIVIKNCVNHLSLSRALCICLSPCCPPFLPLSLLVHWTYKLGVAPSRPLQLDDVRPQLS
jgi:hypothetical protein